MIAALERSTASMLPANDVAGRMEVDPTVGLDPQEAARRLEEFGPNQLQATPREPAWRRFLRQFTDPLIYLLFAAIAVSLAAWLAEGAAGLPVDAVVILLIVIANALIGFLQENKAADAVAALAHMTATRVTLLRGGVLVNAESAAIVPGDVLILDEGDAVGADSRLLHATALRVQEASLTGESGAVSKRPDVLAAPVGVGDALNMVFKGTAVTAGVGRAVVTATGMDTEVGRIATLLDETTSEPTPLQLEIARVSRMLGLLVVGIAVVVMGTLAVVSGVSNTSEAVDILLLGVSLAVAAVPEGLPAILSLVLAIGVQVMARQNAVMKDLPSVETLGSVSVICSDKTGTLTKNEMTLREVVVASGSVILSGTGYAPEGEIHVRPGADHAAATAANGDGMAARVLQEARVVLVGGSLANNAQLSEVDGSWQIQGDPTEVAFLVAGRKLEGIHDHVQEYAREGEVPFNSERKMMSVLAGHPEHGTRIFTKGAPDVLLDHCSLEQVGDEIRPLSVARRGALDASVVKLGEQGYRTLGVAWREADARERNGVEDKSEQDLVFAGIVAIIDPPRPEARAAIESAHRAGIRTVMITGDHPVTAGRIAGDLGIAADRGEIGADEASGTGVVTGAAIEGMDAAALRERTRTATVYARVAPEHKLRIVGALRSDRQIVAMTGDGVNDAPALKSADIGIAMGITGTEVTKDASKMILGDDNYATIVLAVRHGRVIFENIRKFIRYLLSSNMGEVATVFLGVVLGGVIGLRDPGNPGATVVPLLATQILWINLVTDSGPALAMGVDPEIDDVMARPPRGRDERIIDGAMWRRILGTGVVMGVLSIVVYDLMLPGGLLGSVGDRLFEAETLGDGVLGHGGAGGGQLETARTTVFTALVFMQLFNALNSRSGTASAFNHLFTNRWLWVSLAFVVVAQVLVVEAPWLQGAFGTVPLRWEHWLVALGAGVGVLLYGEAVKALGRARRRGMR